MLKAAFSLILAAALGACGIDYNPSFKELIPDSDKAMRHDYESKGEGIFVWSLTFPKDMVKHGYLQIAPDPMGADILNIDENDLIGAALTPGADGMITATGEKDHIPDGTYYLRLCLWNDFSYVIESEIVVVRLKGDAPPYNRSFYEKTWTRGTPSDPGDFLPFARLRANIKMENIVPLNLDKLEITFHDAVGSSGVYTPSAQPLPSPTLLLDTDGSGTNEWRLDAREIESPEQGRILKLDGWTALPNHAAVPGRFDSRFFVKVVVTDENDRIFTRYVGPYTGTSRDLEIGIGDTDGINPRRHPFMLLAPVRIDATVNYGEFTYKTEGSDGKRYTSSQYAGAEPGAPVLIFTTALRQGYDANQVEIISTPLLDNAHRIYETDDATDGTYMTFRVPERVDTSGVFVTGEFKNAEWIRLSDEYNPTGGSAYTPNVITFGFHYTLEEAVVEAERRVTAGLSTGEQYITIQQRLLANVDANGHFINGSNGPGDILEIPANTNIVLVGAPIVRADNWDKPLFSVRGVLRLAFINDPWGTFEFNGNGTSQTNPSGAIFEVASGGKLEMQTKVEILANKGSPPVIVNSGGTFEMTGGRIYNNVDAAGSGTALRINTGGSFKMQGDSLISGGPVDLGAGTSVELPAAFAAIGPNNRIVAVLRPEPSGYVEGRAVLTGNTIANYTRFAVSDGIDSGSPAVATPWIVISSGALYGPEVRVGELTHVSRKYFTYLNGALGDLNTDTGGLRTNLAPAYYNRIPVEVLKDFSIAGTVTAGANVGIKLTSANTQSFTISRSPAFTNTMFNITGATVLIEKLTLAGGARFVNFPTVDTPGPGGISGMPVINATTNASVTMGDYAKISDAHISDANQGAAVIISDATFIMQDKSIIEKCRPYGARLLNAGTGALNISGNVAVDESGIRLAAGKRIELLGNVTSVTPILIAPDAYPTNSKVFVLSGSSALVFANYNKFTVKPEQRIIGGTPFSYPWQIDTDGSLYFSATGNAVIPPIAAGQLPVVTFSPLSNTRIRDGGNISFSAGAVTGYSVVVTLALDGVAMNELPAGVFNVLPGTTAGAKTVTVYITVTNLSDPSITYRLSHNYPIVIVL